MYFQCMLVWLKSIASTPPPYIPVWMVGKRIMAKAKSLVFVIACDMLILHLRYTELDSLHHQEPKPTSPMTNEEPMDEDKAEDSCCWALLAGAVCK